MKEFLALGVIVFCLVRICIQSIKQSIEFMSSMYGKTIVLSPTAQKVLLLKGDAEVSFLGFLFYISCTCPFFLFSFLFILCIFVRFAKLILSLHFWWFTTPFLFICGVSLLVYACVLLVVFGIVSRFLKCFSKKD